MFLKGKIFLVDRVGNAPTTSRMSSEHSTFELTVPKLKKYIKVCTIF